MINSKNLDVITFGNKVYFLGLFLTAFSLPLSKFGMSVGQIAMALGWLCTQQFTIKWNNFKSNLIGWMIIGLFALHVIGLLNTSDFNYALNDLRIKLPLFLLPLLMCSMPPLNEKNFLTLLKTIVLATFFSTVISWMVYLGIINYNWTNIREISIFISHIRLALLVCFSIAVCLYFIKDISINETLLVVLLVAWFIYFICLIESITGLFILFALLIYFFTRYLSRANKIAAFSFLLFSLIATTSIVHYLYKNAIAPIKYNNYTLLEKTAEGTIYESDTLLQAVENGRPIFINVCYKEIEEAWKQRTGLSIYDKNQYGFEHRELLLRYLTHFNYTKDRLGVLKFTNNQINNILNGKSTSYLTEGGLARRVQEIQNEYRIYYYTGYVSGQSVTQRLEYWKTAIQIIAKNPSLGVGTGDVNMAFQNQYLINKTTLDKKWQLRAHNQFLSFGVAFGCIGIFVLLFALLYPLANYKFQHFTLFVCFIIIAVLSMLTEDTLETQAGVTFFAFLNALFAHQNKD